MIANIARACGTNVGGLRHLQIVDIKDVESIPDAIDHKIESSISLVDGVALATIGFTPQSGDFSESPKKGNYGEVIESEIKLEIAKEALELAQWAQANNGRKIIAFYMDENGIAKIIGDLERPLAISVETSSGKKGSDGSKLILSIAGISDHYAYYYQMFEILPAGNRKVYSAGYTFGYQRT